MLYLFVYGSLMSGENASGKLQKCKCLVKFLLEDYAMYDVANGEFPGIVQKKGESVIGEIYEIPESLLSDLDAYENEGNLYTRQTVMVKKENRRLYAIAYIYNRSIENCRILRAAYNQKESDCVWYAGYGSNLNTERFLCYVKGGWNPANSREYSGCKNKSMWLSDCMKTYRGKMYFAKESSSWNGGGVAFYDPLEVGFVFMRLYKITYGQLKDIQKQEGPKWYSRMVCLDVMDDDCPVFTLTSENHERENQPCENYLKLIRSSLIDLLGNYRTLEIDNYLRGCGGMINNDDERNSSIKEVFKSYKLDGVKIGNTVNIYDPWNYDKPIYTFDLTDNQSIEKCKEEMYKDYKDRYDFDMFYKRFVKRERVKNIRR